MLAESIEQRGTSGGAKDAHDILAKLSSFLKDNGIDIAAARDALHAEGKPLFSDSIAPYVLWLILV